MQNQKRKLRTKDQSGKRLRFNHGPPKRGESSIIDLFDRSCGFRASSLPSSYDDSGNTLLHYAALYENDELIKRLVNTDGVNVNAKNKKGETALHLAALTMRIDTVTTLMNNGAKANERESISGMSPLYYAFGYVTDKWILYDKYKQRSIRSDPDTVEKRVELAKILTKGDLMGVLAIHEDSMLGISPLCYVCLGGDTELLRALLSFGFDVNTRSGRDKTLLSYACDYARADIVKMLSDMGADTEACDRDGTSVLSHACMGGLIDVVKSFNKYDALRKQDKFGNTGLHYAARYGHTDIVKFLTLGKSCVVELRNIQGRTPLWYASINGHVDIVRLLVEKRFTPNETDEEGVTTAQFARNQGYSEVADFLETIDPKKSKPHRDIREDRITYHPSSFSSSLLSSRLIYS